MSQSASSSEDLLMLENSGAVVQQGGHINVPLIDGAPQRFLPANFLIEILISKGASSRVHVSDYLMTPLLAFLDTVLTQLAIEENKS